MKNKKLFWFFYKKLFWIFLIVLGGIFMIIGSAIGSTVFYQFIYTNLVVPYVDPAFHSLIQSILTALEYIAFYGGYSVLVGAFFLLIKWVRVGKIIIMVATSFGMLGLIIYALTWGVGYFSIPLYTSESIITINFSSNPQLVYFQFGNWIYWDCISGSWTVRSKDIRESGKRKFYEQ